MFACASNHKRMNHISRKRKIDRNKRMADIRAEAEKNRDRAYEKKWGKLATNKNQTQESYINKYFAV
jgi:hypothetical protein